MKRHTYFCKHEPTQFTSLVSFRLRARVRALHSKSRRPWPEAAVGFWGWCVGQKGSAHSPCVEELGPALRQLPSSIAATGSSFLHAAAQLRAGWSLRERVRNRARAALAVVVVLFPGQKPDVVRGRRDPRRGRAYGYHCWGSAEDHLRGVDDVIQCFGFHVSHTQLGATRGPSSWLPHPPPPPLAARPPCACSSSSGSLCLHRCRPSTGSVPKIHSPTGKVSGCSPRTELTRLCLPFFSPGVFALDSSTFTWTNMSASASSRISHQTQWWSGITWLRSGTRRKGGSTSTRISA